MTLEELLDRIKLEAEFGKEQSDAGISSALASALDEIVVELSRSAAARWRPFQHSFFTFQASNSSILPP